MRAKPGLSIAILAGRRTAAWYDGEDFIASELAARLATAGHRVSLLFGVHDMLEAATRRRLQRVQRRWPGLGPFNDALFLARCARECDLIYVIGSRSLWTTLLAPLLGARVWYRVDGASRRRLLPWRRSATLVLDSEATRAPLCTTAHRLPPTRMIPLAADPPAEQDPEGLSDWELAPGCYYLLVARPCRENHVQEIVEGFLAAHSTFPLAIVGAIDEDTRYASRLRGFAGARVRFIGPVPEPARRAVLRGHALACFHGNGVGGSPSLLHALGGGALLIAYDTAVNRELAGELAWYFRTPQDIPAAVAWAEDLHSAARRAHAAAARARVAERHAWDRVIALYHAGLMPP
jgi:glycosyltransferase involved in cell wall biosynthesis